MKIGRAINSLECNTRTESEAIRIGPAWFIGGIFELGGGKWPPTTILFTRALLWNKKKTHGYDVEKASYLWIITWSRTISRLGRPSGFFIEAGLLWRSSRKLRSYTFLPDWLMPVSLLLSWRTTNTEEAVVAYPSVTHVMQNNVRDYGFDWSFTFRRLLQVFANCRQQPAETLKCYFIIGITQ